VSEQPIKHVNEDGRIEWRLPNGILHREDGPAVTHPDGSKFWYSSDKLHRIDGPAVIQPDGYKAWYHHGERHRIDGPAAIYPDGSKFWYYQGKRHRVDGPAVISTNGSTEYWYKGKQVHEGDFHWKLIRRKGNELEQREQAAGKTC